MTKKDYIAIAKAFKEMKKNPDLDNTTIDEVVDVIACVFTDDNPNFDYQKFTDYINKEEN
jgi:hypothetical protein